MIVDVILTCGITGVCDERHWRGVHGLREVSEKASFMYLQLVELEADTCVADTTI